MKNQFYYLLCLIIICIAACNKSSSSDSSSSTATPITEKQTVISVNFDQLQNDDLTSQQYTPQSAAVRQIYSSQTSALNTHKSANFQNDIETINSAAVKVICQGQVLFENLKMVRDSQYTDNIWKTDSAIPLPLESTLEFTFTAYDEKGEKLLQASSETIISHNDITDNQPLPIPVKQKFSTKVPALIQYQKPAVIYTDSTVDNFKFLLAGDPHEPLQVTFHHLDETTHQAFTNQIRKVSFTNNMLITLQETYQAPAKPGQYVYEIQLKQGDFLFSTQFTVVVTTPPTASETTSGQTEKIIHPWISRFYGKRYGTTLSWIMDAADDQPIQSYYWSIITDQTVAAAFVRNDQKNAQMKNYSEDLNATIQVVITDQNQHQSKLQYQLIPGAFPAPEDLPIAKVTKNNITVNLGKSITLDASPSTAASGKTIAYQWQIFQQPSSSKLSITQTNQARLTFTPDRIGAYRFTITVFDPTNPQLSDQAVVIIKINFPVGETPLLQLENIDGLWSLNLLTPPSIINPKLGALENFIIQCSRKLTNLQTTFGTLLQHAQVKDMTVFSIEKTNANLADIDQTQNLMKFQCPGFTPMIKISPSTALTYHHSIFFRGSEIRELEN